MPLPDLMPDFDVPRLPDWDPIEDYDGAPLPTWLQPQVLFEHFKGGLYIVQRIVPMHERSKIVVVYKQLKSGEVAARDVEDFLAQVGPTEEWVEIHGPSRPRLRFEPVRYASDLVSR